MKSGDDMLEAVARALNFEECPRRQVYEDLLYQLYRRKNGLAGSATSLDASFALLVSGLFLQIPSAVFIMLVDVLPRRTHRMAAVYGLRAADHGRHSRGLMQEAEKRRKREFP